MKASRIGALGTLGAFVLASAGCGFVEEHQVMVGSPSARSAHVELYGVGQPVPRAVEQVALLQAIGHGYDADPKDVTEAIAARARALGCDAVVDLRVDVGATMTHGFGVCVRYSSAPISTPNPAQLAPPPEPSHDDPSEFPRPAPQVAPSPNDVSL